MGIVPKTKIKDTSLLVLTLTFAVILIMLGLTGSGLFNVSEYIMPVIKLAGVTIVFVEVGLLSVLMKKGKGLDFVTGTEIVIGLLVAVEVVLSLIGLSIETLSNFSGYMLMIFGVVFIIEAFVRE